MGNLSDALSPEFTALLLSLSGASGHLLEESAIVHSTGPNWPHCKQMNANAIDAVLLSACAALRAWLTCTERLSVA
jgi:hypothetical protein